MVTLLRTVTILLGSAAMFGLFGQTPAGRVAYWPAENNANDIVGGNNGTLQSGATFAAGFSGQAFSFDGVDDYIEVAANSTLSLTTYTISAWIKPNVVGTEFIVSKGISGQANFDFDM